MPPQPTFTLGIEEEFQVVDPETRELRSHIQEMFAEGEKRLKDEIKREMHEAVIEVGTPICTDVEHARREVTRLRREIINLCREKRPAHRRRRARIRSRTGPASRSRRTRATTRSSTTCRWWRARI